MLFVLCAGVNAFAQNIEQIYMKSGSVVEGYIAEQNPGKYLIVQTTKATIVANSDSLRNKITERISVENLPPEWKEWAEENNKYIDNAGVKQLELVTLEFKNSVYSKVFILEKGSLVKFIDLSPNRYTFKWGDMYRTVKSERPDNLFSGLKEVVVLADGSTVDGQIIEQFPGKDLKIVTDKNEVLSYKFDQVKQINTEKLNPKMDLWPQVQLLDKISVKGEDSDLVGFISSRTLGKELVIEFENGNKRTIPQNQILSYAKIPNENYIAVYDKVIKEGEILLDGKPAYFVPLKTVGQYLVLDSIVSAQNTVGDTIYVEANLGGANVPVTLVKAHVENVAFANGKRKWEIPCPVITYQDLVQSHVEIKKEATPLGNLKVSFVVKEVGDYVLYMQGKEEYIVINVIEKNKQ
ncbi:hypothetical protein [Paraprevotella clara]|uniref:hypothetical protein n=1 Tax=Paraprevotella clara TaxID=454154 RepID=UPI002491C10A|nr:hypothetical protein [Paraprevotella clara]